MRTLTLGTLTTLALAATALPAGAATDYPDRPIHVVVGYSPGGPTDILARQIAPYLAKAIDQQIVIENRPGASGNIAGSEVARADPDGYTLLMGDLTLATNPALMQNIPFDPQADLTAIAPLARAPLALVVNPESGFDSLQALLDQAKAEPGSLTYGTAGNGNLTHLAGEVLKTAMDVEIRQVPYKGSGPALVDLVGGEITMVITGLSGSESFIRAGKLNPLAITGEERSEVFPEIPTFEEATGKAMPELVIGSWWGLFGPADMPEAIVAKLNAAAQQALQSPELEKHLANLNIEPDRGSAADMADRLDSETETWARVIDAAGIQPQ